jgi:hypothetical protein
MVSLYGSSASRPLRCSLLVHGGLGLSSYPHPVVLHKLAVYGYRVYTFVSVGRTTETSVVRVFGLSIPVEADHATTFSPF